MTLALESRSLRNVPQGFDDDRPTPSESQSEAQGMLHDIANALTVIAGWADEASLESADPATVSHALRMITRCSLQARALARRAIGIQEAAVVASAGKIVDDALEPLMLSAARGKVRLARVGDAEADVFFSDELGLIVTNLVINALAFAPEGSRISVKCDDNVTAVVITVSDEGQGVSADRAESIFEGDSRRQGGSGIGLAHSRRVARRRGGDLSLVPSARGATFSLAWPRADAEIEPAPLSRVRAQQLEGLRVLMIEDDLIVSEFLKAALEARGAEVIALTNVKDLDGVDFSNCDAVLADLSPFENDAQRAVEQLRARSRELPIVFVTGSVGEVATNETGIVWVSKPFETRELVDVLMAVALL